ncbi:MAG: YCF48-related protein [Candidatus Margulisbacteria bacterium]|nr:YCF48-related protein [Candidatus Margulisiibacteriota bacterium]
MTKGKTVTRKLLIIIVGLVLFNSLAFASWNTLTKEAPAQNLTADFFIDKNTGFAVGAAGTVLKTVNQGGSFTYQAVGAATINDVIFPAAGEGYLMTNGKLYRSTDTGATFGDITPAALAGFYFLKGGYSGTNRVFSAYPGSGTTSYLYSSTDSGATFSTSSIADFQIYGATLTSDSTWTWGQTVSTGSYIITKNNTTVFTGTSKINKVFFLDKDTGFAVGDNGSFETTTNGGTSWTERAGKVVAAIGAAKNLKSVYFISSLIGWAVGDNGTIIFTKDGGNSFTYYNPGSAGLDTAVNLRDIYIIFLADNVVHAYVVGDNGNVYKLGAPSITAVAPNSKMQGWVGTVEVTGTDFGSGLALTASGSGVQFFSSTAETTTKASGVVIVGQSAAASAREITVTNADLTTASLAGSFTVTGNNGLVTVSDVWFNLGEPDQHLYQPLLVPLDITPSPTISFEVASTAPLTAATLNLKVLLQQSGAYTQVYYLPSSAATLKTANHANVSFTFPATLAQGIATIELYAEDSIGNVGRTPLTVRVPAPAPGPVSGGGGFIAGGKVLDPDKPTVLNLKFPDTYLPQGFTLVFISGPGGDVAYKKSFGAPVRASAISGTVKVTINPATEFASQNIRAGNIIGIATDNATGKRLLKFTLMMLPEPSKFQK